MLICSKTYSESLTNVMQWSETKVSNALPNCLEKSVLVEKNKLCIRKTFETFSAYVDEDQCNLMTGNL